MQKEGDSEAMYAQWQKLDRFGTNLVSTPTFEGENKITQVEFVWRFPKRKIMVTLDMQNFVSPC